MSDRKQLVNEPLFTAVAHIITGAKAIAYRSANAILLKMYWEIGQLIIQDEQHGQRRAEYRKAVLKKLAIQLTLELSHNQIVSCGQKRLDFVLYNEDSKKSAAVEVDGSYHFNIGGLKQNYTEEHLERMEILQRAGWKIINTPYYKWYKDGWLSETSEPIFKEEIERIYKELDSHLFD